MISGRGFSRFSKDPRSKYRVPRPAHLTFNPAGLTTRSVIPAARLIQVTWDTDLYSALLPELGASASCFEHLHGMQDPLLSQIVMKLAAEIEGGFADRILVESLGTTLCVRIARHFVGDLPLPTYQQERLVAGTVAARARLRRGASRR